MAFVITRERRIIPLSYISNCCVFIAFTRKFSNNDHRELLVAKIQPIGATLFSLTNGSHTSRLSFSFSGLHIHFTLPFTHSALLLLVQVAVCALLLRSAGPWMIFALPVRGAISCRKVWISHEIPRDTLMSSRSIVSKIQLGHHTGIYNSMYDSSTPPHRPTWL